MLAVVPRIVWALLSLVGRTWRFEVIAEEGIVPVREGQKAGPEIYCFWHQCVLPCAFYFRGSGAVILISQSFDGELITRILRLFGFDAVRGSSSRGAREGMLGLAAGDRIRPHGDLYRGRTARAHLSNQDGTDQAGADDRRADWRIPSGTEGRAEDEFVGPVSGAHSPSRGFVSVGRSGRRCLEICPRGNWK